MTRNSQNQFLKGQKKKKRNNVGWTNGRTSSFTHFRFRQFHCTQLLLPLLGFWNTNPSGILSKISDIGAFVIGVYEWKLGICIYILEGNVRELILRRCNRDTRPTSCRLHYSVQLFTIDNNFNNFGTHKKTPLLYYGRALAICMIQNGKV